MRRTLFFVSALLIAVSASVQASDFTDAASKSTKSCLVDRAWDSDWKLRFENVGGRIWMWATDMRNGKEYLTPMPTFLSKVENPPAGLYSGLPADQVPAVYLSRSTVRNSKTPVPRYTNYDLRRKKR